MSDFYKGKLSAQNHQATVRLTATQANVESHIEIKNTTSRRLRARIEATRPGINRIRTRRRSEPFTAATVSPVIGPIDTPKRKATAPYFAGGETRVLDIDYSTMVQGAKTKSYMYLPSVDIDKRGLHQKLNKYEVTFQLPPSAKRVIYSSVPLRTRKTRNGLVSTYSVTKAYAVPVSIKWTEHDIDVRISKRARFVNIRGRRLVRVELTVKNRSRRPVRGLVIEDTHPADQAIPFPKTRELQVRFSGTKNFQRVIYRTRVDLAAGLSKKLQYFLLPRSTQMTYGPAQAVYQKAPIAISNRLPTVSIGHPFLRPKTRFVLPSGWSFDFKKKDHHLNEHGMWVSGQTYNPRTTRLSWTTGAIFADKNFDDDYRWFTSHQVFRFDPGFSVHGGSGWLPKSGRVSTTPGSYSNANLRQFDKAIVLLRGWRFDFTSKDHHINKMRIELTNIRFNKNTGTITWNASAQYADKNFDDGYRYQYWYTVLGFNGNYAVRSFSGSDRGGTATHAGDVTMAALSGFDSGMVIPLAWEFDYKSKDHHINENDFRIHNVRYDKNSGRFRWSTHLNYSDKNFDDDYYWRYVVVMLATNDGECRQYDRGPFSDDGGYASKNNSVYLNRLFRPITWTNEIRDGDETGVDCGGSSPARDFKPVKATVNPGNAKDADLYSLKPAENLNFVRAFAEYAKVEYADHLGEDPSTYYDVDPATKPDKLVDAIAWYVENHMEYVADAGSWKGSQSAAKTLGETAHRGPGDFHGDCEDHAILRAALLRSLGFGPRCIYCADHHNSVDQGQDQECWGDKKGAGGHTYNIVIWKGKYRLLDYGEMRHRYWTGKSCWNQHVTDNIWNDHTGEHWSKKDTSPFGSTPLVNYPGNPSSPSPNWNWRTYLKDITE